MTGTHAPDQHRRIRQPSLADAIIPLVILVLLIGSSLLLEASPRSAFPGWRPTALPSPRR